MVNRGFYMSELLWIEEYRPKNIEECILPRRIKDALAKMADGGVIQNYSAVGSAGSGKTSSGRALCNQVDVDYLLINMSAESGIDTVRTKIINYASTMSFSSKYKVIILDECLEENEKVRIGTVDSWRGVPLNELEEGVNYPVVSFNMDSGAFENDTGAIISDKVDTVYEVTMASGRQIKVNNKHPFIVVEDYSTFSEEDSDWSINHKYIELSIADGLDSTHDIIMMDDTNEFGYSFDWVESIESIGERRVINLTVYNNHTFITENGIVTHNCDHASKAAQASLRGVIEDHLDNCRFIITANYANKIIPALYSRCPPIDFTFSNTERTEMLTQFIKRMMDILSEHNIDYDKRALVEYCRITFPDFRKTLNQLQMNSISGELNLTSLGSKSSDQIRDLMTCLKAGNFTGSREWVVNNMNGNDGHLVRRAIYDNMKEYIKDESIPDLVLLTRQCDRDEADVVDKEINFVAYLVEIMQNIEFKG